MKKSFKNFHINVGSSSILLIFVVLCLVSFATLSIASAHADYYLSQKILDRNTAYYKACAQAESSMAMIDTTLAKAYLSCESKEAYFDMVGHSKSYLIPVSDTQTLEIELDLLYPEKDTDVFYKIRSFKVIPSKSLVYEDSLPVYGNS